MSQTDASINSRSPENFSANGPCVSDKIRSTQRRQPLASRTWLVAPVLAFVAVSATGCSFLKSLMGTNSVDLTGAEVKSMSVDIRKDQKTICPRQDIQMGVFLEAVLKGEKGPKNYETWTGKPGANKNGKLEFTEFAFNSDLGTVDDAGWFHPNPKVEASAEKEFSITTAFKKRPDKFTMDVTFKPDYQCIQGAGQTGKPGTPGPSGQSGSSGRSGDYGGDTKGGGRGGDGSPGSAGGNGEDGMDGPKFQAYATIVKTKFYDKLVAIKIAGDVNDLILVPIDQPVTLIASGGPGGSGGRGGDGGSGGSGGSGTPGGDGGAGARGGEGGSGGKGGKGGEIELIVDARYPDLAKVIKLDTAGGSAGNAGSGGRGGSGGSGGSGNKQSGSGRTGTSGTEGASGRAGSKGADGRNATKTGAVADQFSGLQGIALAEPVDAKKEGPKDPGKDPKKNPKDGKDPKGGKK